MYKVFKIRIFLILGVEIGNRWGKEGKVGSFCFLVKFLRRFFEKFELELRCLNVI